MQIGVIFLSMIKGCLLTVGSPSACNFMGLNFGIDIAGSRS
jgi:hypothetical protein